MHPIISPDEFKIHAVGKKYIKKKISTPGASLLSSSKEKPTQRGFKTPVSILFLQPVGGGNGPNCQRPATSTLAKYKSNISIVSSNALNLNNLGRSQNIALFP